MVMRPGSGASARSTISPRTVGELDDQPVGRRDFLFLRHLRVLLLGHQVELDRAPRARTSRRFESYSTNPAFPYQHCYCDY
jgi:hypothetical protein